MTEKNDREISELLDKLREKTVAEAPVSEKPTKKQDKKQMTDDNVRNLLRKYYDDVDPPASGATVETDTVEKGSAEHIFGIDTSDFMTEEELFDDEE